jgi:hypothetical protein
MLENYLVLLAFEECCVMYFEEENFPVFVFVS